MIRLVMCVRVEDVPVEDVARRVIHGSVKETCVQCGKDVWLAPTSQRQASRDEDVVVGCVACVVDAAKRTGMKVFWLPMTPAACAEIAAHLGRN